MTTPLLVVTLLFRSKPQFSALSHVIDAVSMYADASVQLSLAKAAKFGSMTLLNRIWNCHLDLEPNADASWSLRSLLRFEHMYEAYQGNADAVEEAAASGDMDILRLLLEKDVDSVRNEGLQDFTPYHVIRWGGLDMARAAAEGNAQVVEWLQATGEHMRDYRMAMMAAIEIGHRQLVELLDRRSRVPVTQCIVAAAEHGHLHLVEWLHERIPDASPPGLLLAAAANGYLDIVRWIIERDWNNEDLDSNSEDDDPYGWGGHSWDRNSYVNPQHSHVTSVGGEASLAVHAAAVNGHLEVAKYLHARVDLPVDREDESRESKRLSATKKALKDEFGDKFNTAETISQTTMLIAAKKGLLDVVQWLYTEFHVNFTIDILGGYEYFAEEILL